MLAHPDKDFDPGSFGNIAILITFAVTYLSAAIAVGSQFSLETWAILILLGLVSIAIGVLLAPWFFRENRPWKVASFYLLQLALCGTINFIGQEHFWLLFLPLASAAASALSKKALAFVVAAIVLLFILPLYEVDPAIVMQWVLVFSCGLAFVLLFTEVSVRNHQARREVERLARDLEEANRRLREYADQAGELARTRERNRLAREIHDSLGHYLTVIHVQIEAARTLLAGRGWNESAPDLAAALDKAQTLARNGLNDVRKSVAALRAGPLEDLPLTEALRRLADETRETGLIAEYRIEGSVRPLSPQAELALYRTAQEALTNVRKHARASRVDLMLAFQPDSVRLEIRDNGIGMAPDAGGDGKFGLFGLRERVEILHGRYSVETKPGEGVCLAVELPAG